MTLVERVYRAGFRLVLVRMEPETAHHAAMLAIRAEIDEVAAGTWTAENSPLRGAPHTAQVLTDGVERAYTPAQAVFPRGFDPDKYWPPVGRIDQAYGDRNLLCACPPIEEFADDQAQAQDQ